MKIYFDSKNNNSFSNFTLGPNLPFHREWSTMVSSPTERGVVVIGGSTTSWNGAANDFSDTLIELSGDSIGSLTWTILDQRLQCGAFKHVSFQISQAVNDCLEKVTNHFFHDPTDRCNCRWGPCALHKPGLQEPEVSRVLEQEEQRLRERTAAQPRREATAAQLSARIETEIW